MSSRANRRARASARGAPGRSRRTPVRAKSGGPEIPWVPIGIVAAVVLVIAVIGYLIIQANQTGSSTSEWAEAEREIATSTTLPGEGVDLQTIYNGVYGGGEGLENTASHVTRDMNYEEDQGLPPVGGPHWGSSACGEDPTSAPPFCGPVDWGIYRDPWDAESLVHSMEHGGVVVWYSTTNQDIIDELEALVQGYLENDALIVMAPFPDMGEETIAVTVWARRDKFPVSEYSKERVETAIEAFRCLFNPEDFGGAGC